MAAAAITTVLMLNGQLPISSLPVAFSMLFLLLLLTYYLKG